MERRSRCMGTIMTAKMTVAKYLAKMIELSEKTQKQIAHEVGYDRPNVLSMMKQGLIKVPVNRAPTLARALNIDPAYFLGLVLREYMPDAWSAMEQHLGGVLSENERRLLDVYREQCSNGEIELDERRIKQITTALAK